jgi:hypothetical protein
MLANEQKKRIRNIKPIKAKTSMGQCGLYWSRTSDPYPVKVML